jgi:1-acyl-sn-glycerol-3-phosphate acyltransferase
VTTKGKKRESATSKKAKPKRAKTTAKRPTPAAGARRRARQRNAAAEAESAELDGPDSAEEPELGIGSRTVPPGVTWQEEEIEEAVESGPRLDSERDVQAQIRALEERLDGMIRRATSGRDAAPPPSLREQVETAARGVVDRLSAPIDAALGDDEAAGDTLRELLSSDYYLKQWGRIGMRHRSEEVDDFGLDPAYEQRIRPLLEFFYRRYFRVETTGIDNVPPDGRALIVANHSGTLPLDGAMLRTAVRLEHPRERELRWLAEDFVFYLPFVGAFMNRIGAVRACQENAERLLKKDSLVAVFPEGVKGIGKLYKDRYRLQRFGRGGFIRLCLRTRTPIVPCAVVGAEESSPMLYRIEYLSKAVGLPYFPLTPTFPLLGPAGLLPAPTKWRIRFGEVMRFEGYGPEAADDHVLVGRLAERVRATIQGMLDEGVRKRRSVWLG